MHRCLATAHDALTNIEGAHRVHGWNTPLRVANLSVVVRQPAPSRLTVPMVVFNAIGEPTPYVHDVVSAAVASTGYWEVADLHTLATAAGLSSLPPPSRGVVLDIGAGVGTYSIAFASLGYRVVAIEPMTQNTLALAATACLNTSGSGDRIRVLRSAVVGPAHASSTRTTCAVLSAWKADDFGNGQLECSNKSGAHGCDRRHNGMLIRANFVRS